MMCHVLRTKCKSPSLRAGAPRRLGRTWRVDAPIVAKFGNARQGDCVTNLRLRFRPRPALIGDRPLETIDFIGSSHLGRGKPPLEKNFSSAQAPPPPPAPFDTPAPSSALSRFPTAHRDGAPPWGGVMRRTETVHLLGNATGGGASSSAPKSSESKTQVNNFTLFPAVCKHCVDIAFAI